MATMEKSAVFSGKTWGGYCKITYTAGNGSINITGMAFKATNSTSAGYGAYYDTQQTITVTAGGQSRSCTLRNVRIKQTSYVSATFSGASFSGLSGNTTVSFTCRARASSPYNLTFSYAIDAGNAVVAPSGLWCSVTGRTETTATISGGYSSNGGGSITTSGFQYRTASGGWQACGSSLSGLQPSTTYYFRYYAGNSAGTSYSDGNTNTTTAAYPAITSTPNFTIGDELNITFTNPLSRSCDIYVITNDGVSHFGGTRTGTSISPFNNSGWKDIWYQSIPNNPNGKYKVRLVCSSVGRDNTVDGGTYYARQSECNPEFSDFTWADTNAATVALTGNNQVIVNGYSNLTATITTANKATAKNSASIQKYIFTNGSQTENISYSSSATVSSTINKATSNTLKVKAVDSRNFSSPEITKTGTFINYTSLEKTSASIERVGNVNYQTSLSFKGKMWNGNFGSTTNSIQSATYKYKVGSGGWTTGTTDITPSINGNVFTFEGLVLGDDAQHAGFDIQNVYTVVVTITDKLSTVEWTLTLNSGRPHVAYYDTGVAIMGKYDEQAGGALQVKGNLDVDGEITVQGSSSLIYVGVKGDKGDPGPAGPAGPSGAGNSLSIGTVTKGDEALATITGNPPDQVLNLVLPKGNKGDTGATGAAGPANTLDIGTVTTGDEPTVTITGTSPNQILNFVLPKGVKGDRGDQGLQGLQGLQGDPGPANTLSIGTVTSGQSASATITGTSPSQVLNLVLEKGEKGDKGDTGNTGPKGDQGVAGPAGPANSLSIGTVTSGQTASVTITGDAPNQILNFTLPIENIPVLRGSTSNPVILSNLEIGFYKFVDGDRYVKAFSSNAEYILLDMLDGWLYINKKITAADDDGTIIGYFVTYDGYFTRLAKDSTENYGFQFRGYGHSKGEIVHENKTGQLSFLQTSNKSNLVAAINEVNSKLDIIGNALDYANPFSNDAKVGYYLGKPLYRHNINLTLTPQDTGDDYIGHDIDNVDLIYKWDGNFYNMSNYETYNIANGTATNDNICIYKIDRNNIYFHKGSNLSGTYNGYIDIYYTSTNDD